MFFFNLWYYTKLNCYEYLNLDGGRMVSVIILIKFINSMFGRLVYTKLYCSAEGN